MKKTVMCAVIRVARCVLQLVYGVMKLCPVKDRVCFFSRQSDTLTLDFELLQTELRTQAPHMEQVTICHRFRDGRDGAMRFAVDQLRSMYYLATSKACVLDAYWPTVCLLHHRPELKVIQIWHSMGKIKRSGYQTLNMASGRDGRLSRALQMHRNYTYIISGGKAWEPYYCEAFDTTPEVLRSYGLPRLDWLIENGSTREEVNQRHPELQGKIVVLYAPTYRKYPISAPEELQKAFAGHEEYALICRLHPNQTMDHPLAEDTLTYDDEDIFMLMAACDYLITDYSSLAVEGAALSKKTLYFLFDHQRYMEENGLNVDPAQIMPGCTFTTAEGIFEAIADGRDLETELEAYRQKYLPEHLGSSTRNIVNLITGGGR